MPNRSNSVMREDIVHPGTILKKVLEERKISQKDLSDAIGKSTPVINDILQARRCISPEIAFMLEAVIHDIPAFEWLSFQSQYDLAKIKQDQEIAEKRKKLEEWNELKTLFNTKYLKKKLNLSGTPEENITRVFDYFGVSSVGSLRDKYTHTESYFRQSTSLSTDPYNVMTWMMMVRKKSADLPALKTQFDTRQVTELAQKLNQIFYKNEDTKGRTEKVLNKYGIKFVVEENMERTPIDGYSFWDGDNPTIAITLRYKRLDNFAFTIMHELGHIVKHIKRNKKKDYIDIIKPESEDTIETEANDFAKKALYADAPLDQLFEKLSRSPFTSRFPIEDAARTYKISPSIIAGQFQHYSGVYSACRDLLADVK